MPFKRPVQHGQGRKSQQLLRFTDKPQSVSFEVTHAHRTLASRAQSYPQWLQRSHARQGQAVLQYVGWKRWDNKGIYAHGVTNETMASIFSIGRSQVSPCRHAWRARVTNETLEHYFRILLFCVAPMSRSAPSTSYSEHTRLGAEHSVLSSQLCYRNNPLAKS